MNIDVQFEAPFEDALASAVIENAVKQVLAQQSGPDFPALTVVVTGDPDIRALNLEYMGIDSPTDVLSFPSGDLPGVPGEEVYLGDIMISLETARKQAAQGGHSLEQEIELLTVHGVLHLLGFDHGDEADKTAMWEAQAAALAGLSNPLSPP